MTITEIILIGIGLSMDAFSVSLSAGMIYTGIVGRKRLYMPAAFGIFQGLMPIAGYFLGYAFKDIIERFSGPISLIILGIIGLNMIREGIKEMRGGESEREKKRLTFISLIALAIATSIDAFAVGVSFAASGMGINFISFAQNIFIASAIIALTTFVVCIIAVIMGGKASEKLGDKAEILGGVILIIIGIKNMFF